YELRSPAWDCHKASRMSARFRIAVELDSPVKPGNDGVVGPSGVLPGCRAIAGNDGVGGLSGALFRCRGIASRARGSPMDVHGLGLVPALSQRVSTIRPTGA